MHNRSLPRRLRAPLAFLPAAAFFLGACSEPTSSSTEPDVGPDAPSSILQAVDCTASVRAGTVSCAAAGSRAGGVSATVIGAQGTYIKLTSSNLTYTTADSLFAFDVTVQNLLNEAIGTPDGTVLDPAGVRVFFNEGPTATSGTGIVTVHNADGTGDFMSTGQPYFQYDEILVKDEVSPAKRWELKVPSTVESFTFTLYVSAEVQPLLVINEVMVNPENPSNPTVDTDREWFEVYNAGRLPVEMEGYVIADSAASGRRPYHKIASPLRVAPGAYVVLGNTTNTTSSGGVPVDYAFGGALALANSLDAVKLARVYGTDTLTLDRTQYASASVSAKSGISRELTNPALDNSNMDGSNWGDASVTSVYGTGGRGTPKAQNSVFTP